jgi:hypothetical protein
MQQPETDRAALRGAEQAVDELVARGKIDPRGVPPPAERARRAALGLHPMVVRARGRKLELRYPTVI